MSGQQSPIGGVAVSSNLVAVGQPDLLTLWRLGDWTQSGSITARATTSSIAFSPDGVFIAAGGASALYGPVIVNPVVEGESAGKILAQRKNSGIWGIRFSDDGASIVAVGQDETAQVLNARTGEELLRARTREGAHLSKSPAIFTPDGRYLVTVRDTGARLWEISPSDMAHEACARAARNLTREEWQRFVGREPYRKTCPGLP